MKKNTIEMLDYTRILEKTAHYTLTNRAKQTILASKPLINKKQIEHMLNEVKEACNILNVSSSVPIHSLDEVEKYLEQGHKGLYLQPVQITKVLTFLDHCRKLKRFMNDKESVAPMISTYAWSIEDLIDIEEELSRSLKHGQIDDYATPELAKLRRQIRQKQTEVKERAEAIAASKKYANFLQEKHVVQKHNNYAIQVKREYRNKIDGQVIDISASGATVFIMPKVVADIQSELDLLKMSEDNELQQILYKLTGMILTKEHEIRIAMDTMHHYDVLFAKAKIGLEMEGIIPSLNEEYVIDLKHAKHPLIGKDAVPLSIRIGSNDRALVITGPNTGGKTVTLKTVGLLIMMAQTGMMIPAEAGSNIHLFQNIYVDMGDGQSIDENLSTFSSRLKNIIEILEDTNDNSLVLLDELGSGTDPNEGMALAQVIMEQLVEKGATLLATTHYSELKNLALKKPGFINGSMEFDIETLKPTYRLLIGQTGNSQAFPIAVKLGMHPKLVERAFQLTYDGEEKQFSYSEKDEFKHSYQKQLTINRYARRLKKEKVQTAIPKYEQGDNVMISPNGETGIVYKGPDEKGNYIVQLKGEKQTINYKRITLYIAAKELYPDDYDFDIIFKSKEYRKKKNIMERKYVEGLTIIEED